MNGLQPLRKIISDKGVWIMAPREYVPLSIEYLDEMEPLSNEDFGRLIRALLLYARDGTPIELDGDCRFYARRVMNKDQHYARRAEEEEEKAQKRSNHAKVAAAGRYISECSGMLEHAQAGNTKPIQSKPNQDQTNPNQTKDDGAEPAELSASAPASPLNDGTEYAVTDKDIASWSKTYPAVDVVQELREMRAWCEANPKLCKTKNGVRRFIVHWLSKEQDRGHPGAVRKKEQQKHEFVPTEF